MRVEHEEGRRAFLAALAVFLDVVNGLAEDQFLAASRCLGWTAGDVIAHVHMGLQEMLLGIVSPAASPPDVNAASYWRSLPGSAVGPDVTGHGRFVRMVAAAYQRPAGLVGHLEATAAGVASAVTGLAPGAVRFQGHILATGDFLATWAVELAVHHLDLGRELDAGLPAPAALRLARATVEALAGGPLPPSWPDDAAVLLGTGRLVLDERRRREAGLPAGALPVFG